MKNVLYSLVVVFALLLTGCADAGKDQSVTSSTFVTLNANASTASAGGKLKRYKWRQVRGPRVQLSNKKKVQATFTAPTVTKETRLVFKLTTMEFGGFISPFRTRDYVSIVVHSVTDENIAPVAVATVSSNVVKEGESITFDASASSDSDGQIATYSWKDANGVELSVESIFTHTFDQEGDYDITLTITDDNGASASKTVNVKVNALVKPTAVIITSATQVWVNDDVTFDANNSNDADGEIVTYQWLDANGNTLSNELTFTHTFTTSGEHNITLQVMDDDEQVVSSMVTIVVEALLETIEVSSTVQTLIIGEDAQLSATGTYNDGTALDIASSVVWVSSNENVAKVDVAGKLTAIGEGEVNIFAEVAGVQSNTLYVVIELPADEIAPTINLNGGDITLTVGEAYTETVSANDNKDGDITVNINITGTVDTNTAGTYTLTYNVSDAAGNVADTVTRTVTVELPADETAPTITLNGTDVTLTVGDTYTEQGATATDSRDGTVAVTISGTVDTSTAGTYTITYTASDAVGNTATETRAVTVNVAPDTQKPTINLNGGDITLTVGEAYTETVSANDNKDGDITVNINITGTVDTNTAGTYTLTYNVSDAAGNVADTVTRTVTVELPADETAPTITLNGTDVTLTVGDTYTEQGATATDSRDGTVAVTISGTVDTSTAGTYKITYTASDAAGNTATETRAVTVNEANEIILVDDSFSIDLTDVDGYSANDSIEDQYLSVINHLRGQYIKCNDDTGREGPVGSDLVTNVLLTDAAQEHSDDMLATGVFTHDGTGTETDITGQTFTPTRPSTPFERMKRHGYNYTRAGENISYRAAYPTLSDTAWVGAIEGLMKSHTGHCSNIMNPNFVDFGMAEARGVRPIEFNDGVTRDAPAGYWTQNFGAR